MKIFVENYYYDKPIVLDSFDRVVPIKSNQTQAAVAAVGLYKKDGNTIFVLPKIYDNSGYLLGDIPIEEFAASNVPLGTLLKRYGKGRSDFQALNHVLINLYKVLKTYRNRNNHVPNMGNLNIISNMGINDISELDCILSLLQIHRQHGYLYVRQKVSSNSGKRVDWRKTVMKNSPIVINREVLYPSLFTKKSHTSQEDTLLVIFYSVLHYVSQYYGFNVSLSESIPFVKGHEYKRLESRALKILKGIQGKYFSDVLKQILKILIVYFSWIENNKTRGPNEGSEYLLTDNFNLVFEDIVDVLISEPKDLELFKEQRDGKILDHIYHDKSIVGSSTTFFVADSKYYREASSIGSTAKFKQFTYTRNIYQQFFDASYDEKKYFQSINARLRDEASEGYNVIPNIFILGTVNHGDYNEVSNPPLKSSGEPAQTQHFANRLFDRDTQVIFYAELDFNFAVQSYLSKSSAFTTSIRALIRNNVLKWYYETYHMLRLSGPRITDALRYDFALLNGRVFSDGESGALIVAVQQNDEVVLNNIKELGRRFGLQIESLPLYT